MAGESENTKSSGDKDNHSGPGNISESENGEKVADEQDTGADEQDTGADEGNEDVPEDFFDDFLKEDFMAGLDIVDEDDEGGNETNGVASKPKQSQKQVKPKQGNDKKNQNRKTEVKSEQKHNNKKLRKLTAQDIELRRLDKELNEMRNATVKKTAKSTLDADNFDIRRDPEKTRQAIQRDKIKSEKDKEKRLITDIVQTGLVPPGMELEVNIEEVCGVEKTQSKEQVMDLREKIRSRKTRSKSIDPFKKSSRKHTSPRKTTPTRKKKSRSPSRNASASSFQDRKEDKITFGRSRSPRRRSPLLKRSPLHKRNPPNRRRSPRRSPELYAGHASPPKRARSPRWSPKRNYPKKRSRSPMNSPPFRRSPIYRRSRSRENINDYHRRRERSFSPFDRSRRRRSHSRSPKKSKREEKVSFLEELVAKLNETHPHQPQTIAPPVNYLMPNVAPQAAPLVQMQPLQSNFYRPTPVPQPAPVPVQPAPAQPVAPKYDPYDESFFIGNAAPLPGSQSRQMDKPLAQPNVQKYQANVKSDKDLTKLFEDKRIKLSDFLAITSKPQVSNTSSAKLQEKIKVIQRCQDAVKVLNERRFSGPLIVHKTDSCEDSKDMAISPLLRKPIVQLPFTTPGLKNSTEMDFTRCCQTLLYRVGIQKRLTPIMKKHEKPNIVPPKETTQKENSPLFPINTFSETPAIIKVAPPVATKVSAKVPAKAVSVQTDKELCKECLRRKGILYTNCGIQAGNPMLSFSVSTQVTEADFYSMIPKNQSLASLTPAQLLGKQSMIGDPNKSSFFNKNSSPQDTLRGRHIPSPPPPPLLQFPYPPMSVHGDPHFPSPLLSQPRMPSLMQPRTSIPPTQSLGDDRRGGFNKRF